MTWHATTRRGVVRRVVVLAALLALLGACAAPLPTAQPDAVPAALPPAVSADQVQAVLADLAATLEAGDAAVSAEALAPRVTGPALATRTAEYALAAAGAPDAITPIPPAAQTLVVPTTDTWPRTAMVITEAPADLQAPLLLTLVQASPREQYQLWGWARLFPGVAMPATAQPAVGSAPVPADADALAVPPADVLARYVDVLTNRDASAYTTTFAADPLRQGIAATRDAFTGLVADNGTLAETYAPVEGGPFAIATAKGGAIVMGAVRTVTTITLSDSTLNIQDQTAALLGKQTVASNLTITWVSMVAFAVPPAGSTDPIQVLGAEHSRISVTGE